LHEEQRARQRGDERPREIPVEGEPADVVALVSRYDAWLETSPSVPKLLLASQNPAGLQPSPTGSPGMVDWARSRIAGVELASLPPAGHHAAEDRPDEISAAILAWMGRHAL